MIDFKTFDEALKEIQNYYTRIDNLIKILKIDGVSDDAFMSKIINVLTVALKDDSTWIEYWIYELDFGKKYKDGSVTEKINGKQINIPLKTTKQLYKVLIDNYNKK